MTALNTQARDDFYLVRWADKSETSGFGMDSECFTDPAHVQAQVDGFSGRHKVHSILHIFGSVSDDVTNDFPVSSEEAA